MQKIAILCVGKLKEAYWKEACEEYRKRLKRYCSLEILEVVDEKTPDSPSPPVEELIKKKEAERLNRFLREDDYLITLEINGKQMDSIAFSEKIDRLAVTGTGRIVFAIGGSLGLSEEITARRKEALSFSRFTFPHQMMRVILLEQIYRAYRISHHEPYHK